MTLSTLVLLLVPSAYARTVAEPGVRVGCSGEPQYATSRLGPFTDSDDGDGAAAPPTREKWEKRYCSSTTLAGASLVVPVAAVGLSGGLVLAASNTSGLGAVGLLFLSVGAGGLVLEAAPFLGAGFALSSARWMEAGGGSVSRTPAVLGIVLGSTSVLCTGMAFGSLGSSSGEFEPWLGAALGFNLAALVANGVQIGANARAYRQIPQASGLAHRAEAEPAVVWTAAPVPLRGGGGMVFSAAW